MSKSKELFKSAKEEMKHIEKLLSHGGSSQKYELGGRINIVNHKLDDCLKEFLKEKDQKKVPE